MSFIDWMGSFLLGRQMQVRVNDQVSGPRPVSSGVPQGSVLGPLLFLVYIDSVASQLQSEYKIFADDLKLYTCVRQAPGTTPVSSTALVQKDIDTLQTTAASWCLKMNPKKCVVSVLPDPEQSSHHQSIFLMESKSLMLILMVILVLLWTRSSNSMTMLGP